MAIVASQLVAAVSVTGVESAIANLLAMGKASDGAGNTLKTLATQGALVAGAAIIGIGVKAVQMAGNFQEGMTSLVTGAGESAKAVYDSSGHIIGGIKMVSDGILNMAVQTGTSTQALTAGMYMIESAGYHGAAGLAVLQAAAEGAKVGNASLADVANGVTTAMTDYAKSNLTASQATNFLVSVVANGKTHMTDLANSMSTILPTAAAVGVNLKDVGGAMATMTGEGTGAAQASTYLRQMLMAMASPAKAGATALKDIGLTTQEVSDDMKKSLPDTLKLIMTHLAETYKVGSPQYMTALKNISGGAKQMQGMLELTGDHLKTFAGNVGLVGGAMKTGGTAIAGWSEVQGDFNFKISQAKEVVETLMIRIGQALLPVVTQLMNAIIPLITQFSDWITKSGVLQTMIGNVSGSLKSAGGVFGMIKDLIMTLVLSVGHIVKAFGDWMIRGGALKIIIDTVKQVISNVVPPVTHLTEVVGKIITDFITWGNKSGVFNGVLKVLGGTVSGVSGFVGTIIDKFASFIGWLTNGSGPANALKDALLGVGAAIAIMKIGDMVANIGAMIPKMVAWLAATWAQVAATWAEAAAQIAANLPIYLVVAAIGILIAIIVLLVTHWGQVVSFLRGAWQAFSSWFMGALHAVGQFFSNVWNGIVSFIMGVWNHIVSFVKEHALLLLAVITGPIGALVILIVTHWNQIRDFIFGIWTTVVGWLEAKFIYLKTLAEMYFMALVVTIQARIQQIHDFIFSIWNAIVTWIQGKWNDLVNLAKQLWQNIVNTVTGAWTNLQSAFNTLWNNVTGLVKQWPNDALQWGKDLIQNLINGITGMVGNVKSAISNVGNTIKSFLHFSKPDTGPLVDVDTWMPDFGDLLATQLKAQAPKLQAAMSIMVKPLAPGGSSFSGSASPSMAFPAMAQSPMSQVATTLAAGQGTPIILQINGQQYARVVLPYIVQGIRNATGVRGF